MAFDISFVPTCRHLGSQDRPQSILKPNPDDISVLIDLGVDSCNLFGFTWSSSRLCRLNLEDVLEEDVNILPKNPEMLFLRAIAGEHTLWVSR